MGFAMSLGEKLQKEGFKIVQCVVDADTTIAKLANDATDKPVTIISDGTDILCLLLHHTLNNNSSKNIYLKTMRIKNTVLNVSHKTLRMSWKHLTK